MIARQYWLTHATICGCVCRDRSRISFQKIEFAKFSRNFHKLSTSLKCVFGIGLVRHALVQSKESFKRKFSMQVDGKWNYKETRFNSIVLDLSTILNQYTEKDKFLLGLTGKYDLNVMQPNQEPPDWKICCALPLQDLVGTAPILDFTLAIFLLRKDHLNTWVTEGRRGVWVRIPVEQSWAIADLYAIGFKLHHAKHEYIMMKKWLPANEEDKMPLYAFHTVGVSGLVLNEDKGEALVVQDKGKTKMWKFPGGFSEPNEDIGDTAVREVREETGIKSEFKSLLTFRQQHRMAFDQSDLYFICHLRPLSYDITICPSEIVKCEWLPLELLQNSDEATPMTKLVATLALRGMECGFDDVSIKPVEMISWVPPYDKKFKVFHRPLKW